MQRCAGLCVFLLFSSFLRVALDTNHISDNRRHFCSDYHEWVDSVPVLHGSGNQYFVPALYFHEPFRRNLRAWFPEHGPFATLAPMLMRPRNAIWERITAILLREFQTDRLKIGLQARGAFPKERPKHVRGLFMFHLRHCLLDTLNSTHRGLVAGWDRQVNNDGSVPWSALGDPSVPPPARFDWGPRHKSPEANETSVTVALASMDEAFPSLLAQRMAQAGWDGRVHLLTSDRDQSWNSEEHIEHAILDVFTIALGADTIFTTIHSTFGYIISGLSPAPSHFVHLDCPPAFGEPCFQKPPRMMQCCNQAEPFAPNKTFREIRPCHDMDQGLSVHPPEVTLD